MNGLAHSLTLQVFIILSPKWNASDVREWQKN